MAPKKKLRRKKQKAAFSGRPLTGGNISFNVEREFRKASESCRSGQLERAAKICRKILKGIPNHPDTLHLLGFITHQVGRSDTAINLIGRAIEHNPRNPIYYLNLGVTFQAVDKLEQAIQCYEKALRLKPDLAGAYYNMGTALVAKSKYHEAISCFRKVLDLDSTHPEAHNNMGVAFHGLKKLDEAISYYRRAIALRPDYAEAYCGMASALEGQCKVDRALSFYQQALQLRPNPGLEAKMSFLVPPICQSREMIEQLRKDMIQRIQSLKEKGLTLKDPLKQVGSVNFYLAYHGLNDKELQMEIASLYVRMCPELAWTSFNYKTKQRIQDKIRIGISSKFLRDHTIGKLNCGIIKNLSREKFHVTLFRIPGKEDNLSKAIDRAADEVVILPENLTLARQRIGERSIDILLYLDIGMEPLSYFLAFSRLAPVQCATWGHPVTTGIPNIDYFISSENAEPSDAEDHYSERLVLLKRFAMYCYRVDCPKEVPSREVFGLPESGNLYVCPQSLFKFHPDFDDALGSILHQDPQGVLVLFEEIVEHQVELLRERFSRSFPDSVHRVRFIPKMLPEKFLSFLRVADVVLDTFHFSGGYTSLVSLACGVPVVTHPGRFMRGRLTLAFYKQMDVMDCVADSAESYINIALKLANDRIWRDEVSEKIRVRADVLYEDIEAVHELERFFEWAVEEERKRTLTS